MADQTTARELLWRHGLPEDVIDGALCLHAQEIVARQRAAHDQLRPYYHSGQVCKPEYDCHVRRVIDVAGPAAADAVPTVQQPPANRAASGSSRAVEAELYVLLRKAGEDRHEAQALIDRHRDEVLRRAELRRMADEPQPAADQPRRRCAHTDVVYGRCVLFLDDHDGECVHENQPGATTAPAEAQQDQEGINDFRARFRAGAERCDAVADLMRDNPEQARAEAAARIAEARQNGETTA